MLCPPEPRDVEGCIGHSATKTLHPGRLLGDTHCGCLPSLKLYGASPSVFPWASAKKCHFMPVLSDVCPEPATIAQLMAGTLERRTKNSFDLTCCFQGLSWQLVPPPLLHAESTSAGVCVWGGGGLPGLAKQWKVLESILILRKSLSPTAGAVLVHNSCCARLGDPLSLPDLAFWVVLRESADGACVWIHRYIWLRGHLGTYDKLLVSPMSCECLTSDSPSKFASLFLNCLRGAENLSYCSSYPDILVGKFSLVSSPNLSCFN